MDTDWHHLLSADPIQLQSAREQLHHAVQIPAMVSRSFLPAHEEDEYGSLIWSHSAGGFVSQTFNEQWQVALKLRSLTLSLLKQGSTQQTLELDGLSLSTAVNKLRGILTEQGMDGSLLKTDLPYEVPQYRLDYSFKSEGLENERIHFTHLFANCSMMLDHLSTQYSPVGESRCWPHHFDLAALLILPDQSNGDPKTTIGWGFSPGDEPHPLPYFYVNCWPYPEVEEVPPLSYGKWNLEGWIGTTLSYQDFADNPNQQNITKEYFNSSITALKQLLIP